MATLTNTKIKDTYDGLLKTTNNEAIAASGVTLIEDGLGNASALSVGRSGNGVTITGSLNATLATAAQPNITSVGTLSSLAVSGNLVVDTNTLYVDAASNWVGIGTTTRLDSATKFQITANSSGVTSFSPLADDVIIEHNSNVGITLASPNTTLQTIAFADPQSPTAGYIFYDHSADALRVGTAGSERLCIESSGNVGIGTSSPRTDINTSSASGSIITLENSSTALNSGDSLGKLNFYSNDTSSSASGVKASIDAEVESGFAATSLTFSTAGYLEASASERMRIDSSGNVEINGSAAPFFGVKSTASGTPTAFIYASTNGADFGSLTNHPTKFYVNNSEKMRIDSNGRVGIGRTPVAASLEVEGQIRVTGTSGYTFNSGGDTDGGMFSTGDGTINFRTNGSERMRITSGGTVLIGKQSENTIGDVGINLRPIGALWGTVSGDVTQENNRIDSTGDIVRYRYNNTIVGTVSVTGSSTAYNTSSDYRLKENVVPMEGALDRVDALKPSRFNFIADPSTTVDGFLAHEVQDIIPEAVNGEKDAVDEEGNPIYQGIDQSKIVPLLVGAIKELSAKVAALESQLNA